jgi:hypothetical protein
MHLDELLVGLLSNSHYESKNYSPRAPHSFALNCQPSAYHNQLTIPFRTVRLAFPRVSTSILSRSRSGLFLLFRRYCMESMDNIIKRLSGDVVRRGTTCVFLPHVLLCPLSLPIARLGCKISDETLDSTSSQKFCGSISIESLTSH